MSVGRRFLEDFPRLTGRSWEDVAPNLEGFLRRLWESESDGIPSGFNEYEPEAIEVGDAGDDGEGNSLGWAAADHEHPVATGAPASLANANTEGSSTSVPRLDHQHKRDVRVQEKAADVGTRNALNFKQSLYAEDDSGNDKVDVYATPRRWAALGAR